MTASMKFGISLDMINLLYQEPNRNRYESRYFWEELYTLIAAAGFRGIEIPFEPLWDFGGRSGVPYTSYTIATKYGPADNYLRLLNDSGIEKVIGVHFDPRLFMRGDLDGYFGAFGHFASRAIAHAGDLGAPNVTLTPTPSVGLLRHHFGAAAEDDAWARKFLERTEELFGRLGSDAEKHGVTLSLRKEYWSLLRGKRIAPFVQKLAGPFRLDIDTAHLRIAGIDPVKFIRKYPDLIGTVHLTDTSFVDDEEAWKNANPEFPRNRATQVFRDIGQGDVDLKAVYGALQSTGYAGWLVCSCRQTRDPMRALLRTRRHIDNHILPE